MLYDFLLCLVTGVDSLGEGVMMTVDLLAVGVTGGTGFGSGLLLSLLLLLLTVMFVVFSVNSAVDCCSRWNSCVTCAIIDTVFLSSGPSACIVW